MAPTLALAIVVVGRGTARLGTFLGLYWLAGGLLTLRFAWRSAPVRARRGLVAGMTTVVGAVLMLLRDGLAGLVHPDLLVQLLGDSALLTGLLRILGGFAAERRWTLGGMVLGTLEAVLGGVALLSADIDPEMLWAVAAAWAAVSGSLLVAAGLRLRRLARTWRS